MTIENRITIVALESRMAELEAMLKRNQVCDTQTHADYQAELAIARNRFRQMCERAICAERGLGGAEKRLAEANEEISRLHQRVHDLNGDLTAAFGILQFFVPEDEALETLSRSEDNSPLMEWPCRLSAGDFRAAAEVVQLIIKRRVKAA
jgi:hypothetical protein